MKKKILLFVFFKLLKYLKSKDYVHGTVNVSFPLYEPSKRKQFEKWKRKANGKAFIVDRYLKIGGLCELCFCKMRPPFSNGRSNAEGELLTIEHKRPISKGGNPVDTENMLLVCHPCNYKRAQKLLEKKDKIVRVVAR